MVRRVPIKSRAGIWITINTRTIFELKRLLLAKRSKILSLCKKIEPMKCDDDEKQKL